MPTHGARLLLYALTFCAVCTTAACAEIVCDPNSNPPAGPIRGECYEDTSVSPVRRGRFYRMIPYATPPVGALRWTHARPHPVWTERMDLSSVPIRVCAQPRHPGTFFVNHEGSEDCLTLAIWSPFVADSEFDSDPSRLLPTMVWITGGSFTAGKATDPTYNGTSLSHAGGGVIQVNVNYRLGQMSGLAHAGLGDATNFGFSDQIRALEWVRDNIRAFGGDPNRVTLFGESAGGSYVYYHLVSTVTRGLYHRAIAQSGMPGLPLLTLAEAKRLRGSKLELQLDCTRSTPAESLACMRSRSQAAVLEAMSLGGCPAREGELSMMDFAAPVRDNVYLHTTDIIGAFSSGHFARDKPVMMGTTGDEASFFPLGVFPVILTAATYKQWITEQFAGAAAPGTPPLAPGAADAVLRLFPANSVFGSQSVIPSQSFAELVTASWFECGTRRVAIEMAKYAAAADDSVDSLPVPTSTVHVYEFNQIPDYVSPSLGAFHGTELGYVFDTLQVGHAGWQPSDADRRIIQITESLWTSFAYGRPLMVNRSTEWPARTLSHPISINVKEPIEFFMNRHAEVCDVFDAFRLYGATNYHIADDAEPAWIRAINVLALAAIELFLSIASGGTLTNGTGTTVIVVAAIFGFVLSPTGATIGAVAVLLWWGYVWRKRHNIIQAASAVAAAVTPRSSAAAAQREYDFKVQTKKKN